MNIMSKHLFILKNQIIRKAKCDKRNCNRRTAQRGLHRPSRRQESGGTSKRRKKHFFSVGNMYLGRIKKLMPD